MQLIDTHCHLVHGRLRQRVPAVLDRAAEAGVVALICAAGNVADSKAALGLTRTYGQVYCLAGVHPHDAKEAAPGYLDQIASLAADPKNVAIGEIGLDYHYDFSPRDRQRSVFAEQLELARRLGKPVVIHTREAFEDTMAILADAGADGEKLVFHSCTESADNVRRMLAIGAVVSFSGIVTFRKTGGLREAARLVPDDRVLVETDAPFLSPEPVRKIKTNEPAHVAHVAVCLAAVRNTSPEAFAAQTTANAVRVFGLELDGRGAP